MILLLAYPYINYVNKVYNLISMEADEKGSCEYVDEYKVIRLLGAGYTAEYIFFKIGWSLDWASKESTWLLSNTSMRLQLWKLWRINSKSWRILTIKISSSWYQSNKTQLIKNHMGQLRNVLPLSWSMQEEGSFLIL